MAVTRQGGSTTTLQLSRATQTAGGTGGGALPARIVGAYWHLYDGPSVAEITSAAPEYNMQYAAFAFGNGSGGGTAVFNPAFQSSASFMADMHASQAAGCKWLLSMGGGVGVSEQVFIRNETDATQLVNSLISIVDQYGFDGIDFDLENGPDGWTPSVMASVARQMKAHYGPNFIVSIVPRPYESYYFDTAVMMGNDCDLVGLQFYDYKQTSDPAFLRTWILDKINELVNNYGIPASKIVVGCATYYPEYGNGANTVAVYRDIYLEARQSHPNLRGVFVWDSDFDKKKNWEFARVMGASIL